MKAYALNGYSISVIEVEGLSNGLYWKNGARYSATTGHPTVHATWEEAMDWAKRKATNIVREAKSLLDDAQYEYEQALAKEEEILQALEKLTPI